MINESIKGVYVNDDRDVGYLARRGNKYSFISLFQFDENHDRVFSIALYDKTTQKIASWLVRKVKNYKLSNKGDNFAQVTYTDETGNTVNKYIGYKNNTYVISNVNQFGSLPDSGNAMGDIDGMPRPDYDGGTSA